ncbi:hypothetical protein DFP72DRAFT_1171928 [Ephemerocybe angulata]|uniref:Uncharacterized protein n=1 Tax=Ephemerocybe angulata TaxID=980116 RepID=A0A8H6HSU1_9AGAR|nr:hypothetical protein DFP72DRAFT_1171928 [Tulosesus angulatus]
MKLPLAPLVSLLFGASYLVANTIAYSYNDYNELDARYQIDDVLSERGFGLEARETIDVPFQPSLRAFLEEAVTAHRRSVSEDEGHIEARNGNEIMVSVNLHTKDPNGAKRIAAYQVPVLPTAKVSDLKQAVATKANISPFNPEIYGILLGKTQGPLEDQKTLENAGVTGSGWVDMVEMFTVDVNVYVAAQNARAYPVTVQVYSDMMLPVFRKVIQPRLPGINLDGYEVRLGEKTSKIKLDESKTLTENGVKNRSQIAFIAMITVHATVQGVPGTFDLRVTPDTTVPRFKKMVGEKVKDKVTLKPKCKASVDGRVLLDRTLSANGVINGNKIEITF